MSHSPQAVSERPLRADAVRNRARLAATAGEIFAERGTDAPLEEIARRAGVGIGTLYRHFPTRNALVEAVYRHEVETLTDGVSALLADNDPGTALGLWMKSFVRYAARKRGMVTALRSMFGSDSELFTSSRQRIYEAVGTLVAAAVADGAIRSDVSPEDLLSALGGVCMAADTPGWQDRSVRLIDLLMDGLRYGAPGAS